MPHNSKNFKNVGEDFDLAKRLQAERASADPLKAAYDEQFEIEPYGRLYELPIAQVTAYIFCAFGLWDQVVSASQSDNPQGQMLALADTDLPETEFSVELAQGVLGSCSVILNSLECVRMFNLWMHELIDEVARGNDDALFKAVLVDACVLEAHPVAKRIAQASLGDDRSFFDRLSKAITRTKPTRPKPVLDDTRLMMEVLDEAGELARMTDSELTDWITHLDLYPIDGDALQAIRRQRRNRVKARNHQNAGLGDSHQG